MSYILYVICCMFAPARPPQPLWLQHAWEPLPRHSFDLKDSLLLLFLSLSFIIIIYHTTMTHIYFEAMSYIIRPNLNVIARYVGVRTPERHRSGVYLVKKMLEKIKDTQISSLFYASSCYVVHVRITTT